jgi:hypothetical protein
VVTTELSPIRKVPFIFVDNQQGGEVIDNQGYEGKNA